MVTSPVRRQRDSISDLTPDLSQPPIPDATSDAASSLRPNQKPARSAEPANNFNLVRESPLELPVGVPLFGTDGIRGKAGDFLNGPLALHAGFWFGRALLARGTAAGPVLVGQDSRNSSDMLAAALTAGLASAGLEVWQVGLCPTPCVAYLIRQVGAAGGVMISASHNPPGDNGLKFFGPDGTKLSKALQAQIEAAIRDRALPDDPGATAAWGRSYARPDLTRVYANSLEQTLAAEGLTGDRPLAGLKVVLDAAWGAAARVAPTAFRELGAEVVALHDRPDGDRINVGCGSTHLEPLQAAVRETGADLGFAFDGDADRVLATDATGRVIDGDYILYLWGDRLRQAGKLPQDTIVATVMSNLGFERAWERRGGTLLRTPVGDQHVHQAMVERGAALGGEQSGHILCHHYGVSGDGTLAALHLAAIVRQSGRSLAELAAESFETYPQLLHNVRVEDRDRRRNWHQCEPLAAAIARAEADMGADGRVLVRASGTEPLIRVMVEAADAALAQRWTEDLTQAVRVHLTDR